MHTYSWMRKVGVRALGVVCGVVALSAYAQPQPILELDTHLLDRGLVKAQSADRRSQPVVMGWLSRGTFIDGTAREAWLMGPQLAANPGDPGATGDAGMAGVRLSTGECAPTSVDLALPCPGPAWPIGRDRCRIRQTKQRPV